MNSMAILFVGRAQRARTSELNGNFVCMYVCINRPRSVRMRPRATRKRSRPCLFRSLRSPTNALHSPSMSSTDRGQCACVPAQRANVAGLASSARCARPQMLCILLVCMYASTDRGQCACVPAQRANVAGLASSARCARPQMLCILLVCHQPTAVSAHASPRNAQT